MKKPLLLVLGALSIMASCKKDENKNTTISVKPYTVPAKYEFSNANYTTSTQRVKMMVELNSYLATANAGTATITLDQAKVNNMFNNTNSPFADASLNTATISLNATASDASLYKSYADSVLIFNTGATGSAGVGGFVPRGANKIVCGPRGLEYTQALAKGMMGGLFFKEAVRLLTSVKTIKTEDTVTAQSTWDEAFGYLSVPANYDTATVYVNTDPNRPLLWGGYLYERGRGIQAGGVIFNAFLKGRAAIGGYDVTVRNAQVDIILEKWEQLAAAAALNYVTAPTASSAIGNFGTQLHALSEGHGFIASLKYRASTSKLSAADFATLSAVINTDFYVLLAQPGFTDLVKAQNILKATYGL